MTSILLSGMQLSLGSDGRCIATLTAPMKIIQAHESSLRRRNRIHDPTVVAFVMS